MGILFPAILSTDKSLPLMGNPLYISPGDTCGVAGRLFQQQLAVGLPLPWNELPPGFHCIFWEHQQGLLMPTIQWSQRLPSLLRPTSRSHGVRELIRLFSQKGKIPGGRRFNKGECRLFQDACHSCLACGAPHPISACGKFKMGQSE